MADKGIIDKLLSVKWLFKRQVDTESPDTIRFPAPEPEVQPEEEDLADSTGRVAVDEEPPDFPDVAIAEYVRLPETKVGAQVEPVWRVVLIGSDPEHKPLGLEIRDGITIGRMMGNVQPDLDLSDYGAARQGVSRKHALLYPSQRGLVLMDLGSLNGTSVNGTRLGDGVGRVVKDGDTLSFGNLHLKIKVIAEPGTSG